MLTPQQERFCREYLLDLNGSAAYRRAYPKVSEKVARVNAAKLLAKASVRERVAELQKAAVARSDLSADRVLRELALIAFQRNGPLYRPDGSLKSPSEWDEATDASIAGVETEEALAREDRQEGQAHGGALARSTARGALLGHTHKVKRWDKLRALELLCKHLGLLKEDAPHPDRPKIDLAPLADAERSALLKLLRERR